MSDAVVVKPIMDSDCKSHLTSYGIDPKTCDFLESIGCVSVTLVATWCDTMSDVTALAGRSPTKDEALAPKLKAAWVKAKALLDKANAREARATSTSSSGSVSSNS